ncbi:Retrovirus-related Pol polyprotein from transposon TNT 1-94 [Vitis vinifera]|uniref:Retrovirus-related Pol polyprotein from transposon TNT 1-94 n=1 Tax=Vitis vinifera TaxID=29760 RepID=A0A438G3W5_VITVI|nr:Retrovirus-related Pol polyprotein from transposon TNT 1-94 [Vitis vinifera]
MPTQFWGDSILTATYLINRMPSRVLSFVTPLQKFQEFFPHSRLNAHLSLRVFGSTVFVHIHGPKRNKFDPRALKCVFLGYSFTQKGYKCYDPISQELYVSKDVTFFEHTPYYSLQGESMSETRPSFDYLDVAMFESTPCLISNPPPDIEGHLNSREDMELQTNKETLVYSRRPKSKFNETLISKALKESEPVIVPTPREYGSNSDQVTDDLPIAIRKQPRSCTLHPISNFVSYNSLSTKCRAFTTNLDRIQLPKNIQEAFEIPEWKETVMEEIRALEKNETWEVMNLPRGKKPVGCKWIFTVKYKVDGTVERYKARLVAKGFTQTYGITIPRHLHQ